MTIFRVVKLMKRILSTTKLLEQVWDRDFKCVCENIDKVYGRNHHHHFSFPNQVSKCKCKQDDGDIRGGNGNLDKFETRSSCPNCTKNNNTEYVDGGGNSCEVVLPRMTEKEKKVFCYNPCEIKWKELIAGHHFHFRRKVLKEPDESIPRAIERMKK